MAAPFTVTIEPNYTATGRPSGWRVSRGSRATKCKNMRAAEKKAVAFMHAHFKAGGKKALYVIHDENGHKHSVTEYSVDADGKASSVSLPVAGPNKAPTRAPTSTSTRAPTPGKAEAKAKPKGESKGKGKQNAGLKKYQSFLKARKAEGMTHEQAVAAWAKKGATAPAAGKGKGSGKGKAAAASPLPPL